MNTITARGRLVWTACLSNAVLLPAFSPALAQEAPGRATAAEDALEEVVITGTRLNLDGYRAPTPVTVLGLDEIQAQAPKDITDVVNQIPSIVGSMTPVARSVQASNGTNGISTPALRGLGSNRTLILLDGQRSAPVTQTGETDIENFPQQLIKRVDVVTGGASAAYGSDALAGVVNFILDRDFTGVKTELSGGQSSYHDDRNWKANISAGFKFADDRGHVLLSGEYSRNDGIFGNDFGNRPPRDWQYGSPGTLLNPAFTPSNGQPEYLVVPNYASATATKGGIITTGPLRGTAFAADGTPYQFNFGTLDRVAAGITPTYMSGGDWEDADITGMMILDPEMRRSNLFSRVSYDLTENLNVYVQGSYSKSYTRGGHSTFANQGDLTIQADNAFLPPSVRAQAQALGVTSFRFGRFKEGERQGGLVHREVERYVVGAEGKFDAFGKNWDWNAYAQRGKTNSDEEITGVRLTTEYNNAIDAVVHPTTGAITCRSTLTNPSNGCVPFNVFGWQGLSPAVDAYAFGGGTYSGIHPNRVQVFTQDVIATSVRGEPFSSWAGPVSLAMGLEYRKEKSEGVVDPLSVQQRWATVIRPLFGSYNVTEGFVETNVPLAVDRSFAKSLDFNAAVRATDYSVSGYVTTWKGGVVWAPIDDIRFRVTRSRDIRAPNMSELFTPGLQITAPVRDPFRNNEQSSLAIQFTTGNLGLEPEKADTTGVGIVLQPRFLEGLSASIDYYHIKVSDAIGILGNQPIVDQCFAGRQVFCPAIERATSGTPVNGFLPISRVTSTYFNFTEQLARGIDFEATYRRSNLTYRLFVTRFLENTLDNGVTPAVDLVGDMRARADTPAIGAIPVWKGMGSITYSTDPVTGTLSVRAVSSGNINNTYIECTSGCPVSTPDYRTINDNHVSGAVYFDASVAYKPDLPASPEFFFSVRNIANKDPAVVPRGPGGLAYGGRPTNEWVYDVIGRSFRAGVRFEF